MIINLIDRVKHQFSKDKALSASLYKILGFFPHNLEIYRVALAHKSQAYRNKKGNSFNNERLEFLGDAILEAVVSDIVYHRYERSREGFLTTTRAKIVQRSSLNRLAAEIGLIDLIHSSALRSRAYKSNVGGNAFEALLGAVYLDRGYAHCKWFVERRIVGQLVDVDTVATTVVNFKSKLLEWTQKNRLNATFRTDRVEGEGSNNPLFEESFVAEEVAVGRGTGHTRKDAQQAAARDALKQLSRSPRLMDSVYRSKERRTAMEALEICALPKIPEIEAEIAAEKDAAAADRKAGGRTQRTERSTERAAIQAERAEREKQRKAERKKAERAEAKAAKSAPKTAPTPKEEKLSREIDEAIETVQDEAFAEEARLATGDDIFAALAPEGADNAEATTEKKRRRRGHRGGRNRNKNRKASADAADASQAAAETSNAAAETSNTSDAPLNTPDVASATATPTSEADAPAQEGEAKSKQKRNSRQRRASRSRKDAEAENAESADATAAPKETSDAPKASPAAPKESSDASSGTSTTSDAE